MYIQVHIDTHYVYTYIRTHKRIYIYIYIYIIYVANLSRKALYEDWCHCHCHQHKHTCHHHSVSVGHIMTVAEIGSTLVWFAWAPLSCWCFTSSCGFLISKRCACVCACVRDARVGDIYVHACMGALMSVCEWVRVCMGMGVYSCGNELLNPFQQAYDTGRHKNGSFGSPKT